jgi:hypothetical protein
MSAPGPPHPVQVLDPFLDSELGAELDEQLGLQLGEPGLPAAHRPRRVAPPSEKSAGVMLTSLPSGRRLMKVSSRDRMHERGTAN